MFKHYQRYPLAALCFVSAVSFAAPYEWNYPAPEKQPIATSDNGKVVYFDVSHGGTEGNADWVIDGAFSDFADALVAEGYTVKEYRGVDKNNDGIIQFVDDYTNPSSTASAANEAVITLAGISSSDVLVLAESNRPFTLAEQAALEQYIASGKGIFFIGDHYNADRNLNTWDSTEVFNGYNRSNLTTFNIGGAYGDLRNPGSATGWLAQNFGIRFRFNAIDWHPGASDIASISQSEGVTAGAGSVLMAGGATLAITDPSRAKGIVYFSNSDNPSSWSHAVDSGLYYGGQAEGPYVAIAKSGSGKAAFIGDSSPIEDASPKYKRQDNGNTKSTYPGWTDAGNAAQLSINIINWLATPESYTHFNSSAHPAGFATPNAMAPIEQNDPDNGQPWSNPSAGYNPWDASTFAHNAYGAPSGTAANNGGNSNNNVLSVTAALALNVGDDVTVQGVITQAINGIYALEIADTDNATIYIKLDSLYRDDFSPQNNPSLVGQILQVTGMRDNYMGAPSIEFVTAMQIIEPLAGDSVSFALAQSVGTTLTVIGEITQAINGIYALEMVDLNDANSAIYVKLDSAYRDQFSPENNPSLIGQTLQVTGTRDNYMSAPSLEYVTDMQVGSNSGGSASSTANGCGNVNASSVDDAYNSAQGTPLTVIGEVTAAINGTYALELMDLASSTTIYVKLESSQRANYSPENNPAIIGKVIEVTGVRDLYMSYASIESVTAIQEVQCN